MDSLMILLAFGCGYAASLVNLPPLVGYLVAGFALSMLGYQSTDLITAFGDTGVTLLLFTIGLKLNVKGLLRPEVWAGATIHMLCTVGIFAVGLMGLSATGFAFFAGMSWSTALLIGFALSFSSTVFAVKILEESGRSGSVNGRTAIGVLIMQDIFAVLFLTFSTGKIPSPWAIAILAVMPVARWVFMRMLDRIGHGELQVLFGFFLALVAGAAAFDVVGLKADLGALIMGILLAPHPRAKDLAYSLLSLKDLMLVGFFLDIGLIGLPSLQALGASVIFMLVLPIKVALFYLLFTRFTLKARTSFVSSFNLANYSEFGLIVGGLAVSNGWLAPSWLLAIAVALSISFVVASPFNRTADALYDRFRSHLKPFETEERHPDEEPYERGTWQIVIVGMGRIGTGTYDYFTNKFGPVVLGLDFNADRVDSLLESGRQAALADVTDPEFWRKLPEREDPVKLLVLCVPSPHIQLDITQKAREFGFAGKIAAVAQFDDEVEVLMEGGVDIAFNAFSEAGVGMGSHICKTYCVNDIEPRLPKAP